MKDSCEATGIGRALYLEQWSAIAALKAVDVIQYTQGTQTISLGSWPLPVAA